MQDPDTTATDHGGQANRPARGQMPFAGLNSRFLRRSVMATFITLALVAMTAAVYWSPAWAGYYLFAGVWAVGFLGLTPLIMKYLMFERRLLPGLLLIGLKLFWLLLMFAVGVHWQKTARPELLGSALAAGVVTPLLVIALRAAGAALDGAKQGMKPKS